MRRRANWTEKCPFSLHPIQITMSFKWHVRLSHLLGFQQWHSNILFNYFVIRQSIRILLLSLFVTHKAIKECFQKSMHRIKWQWASNWIFCKAAILRHYDVIFSLSKPSKWLKCRCHFKDMVLYMGCSEGGIFSVQFHVNEIND